jgi:hypothetical protein
MFVRKPGTEILPAASDHHAVALRKRIPESSVKRKQVRWKMSHFLMKDKHIQQKIRAEWLEWRKRKQDYPDVTQWWERCRVQRMRNFIRREMAERNPNDFRLVENHLYACIYDLLGSDIPLEEKLLALHLTKRS